MWARSSLNVRDAWLLPMALASSVPSKARAAHNLSDSRNSARLRKNYAGRKSYAEGSKDVVATDIGKNVWRLAALLERVVFSQE